MLSLSFTPDTYQTALSARPYGHARQAFVLFALFTVLFSIMPRSQALTVTNNTTYYIANTSCSDGNNGTSTSTL